MKLFSQYDRFDLEQDILKQWNIAEVVEEFARQYMDGAEAFSTDQMANKLSAIVELINLQGQRTWDGFEVMIANGRVAANSFVKKESE